jgi:hypothetical protein
MEAALAAITRAIALDPLGLQEVQTIKWSEFTVVDLKVFLKLCKESDPSILPYGNKNFLITNLKLFLAKLGTSSAHVETANSNGMSTRSKLPHNESYSLNEKQKKQKLEPATKESSGNNGSLLHTVSSDSRYTSAGNNTFNKKKRAGNVPPQTLLPTSAGDAVGYKSNVFSGLSNNISDYQTSSNNRAVQLGSKPSDNHSMNATIVPQIYPGISTTKKISGSSQFGSKNGMLKAVPIADFRHGHLSYEQKYNIKTDKVTSGAARTSDSINSTASSSMQSQIYPPPEVAATTSNYSRALYDALRQTGFTHSQATAGLKECGDSASLDDIILHLVSQIEVNQYF